MSLWRKARAERRAAPAQAAMDAPGDAPRTKRRLPGFRQRTSDGQSAAEQAPILAGYRRPPLSAGKSFWLYLAMAVVCVTWGVLFALAAPFKIMPLLAPLPLLVLFLIWALPDGEYAPTKLLEPLYLAFFAALVLWPNYIAVTLPHMPWLTMLRIFGAPLVLVLLISISVSARFRGALAEVIGSDRFIWRMLVGFVVMQTISLAFTDRLNLSLNRYIVDQLNHTAIFVVSCYLFRLPTFATRWVHAYLAMAFIVCFVGLWQKSLGQLPWVGHIPPLLKVDSALIDNLLDGVARAAIGINRVQSISTSPLGLAELLGLAAPFGIHIAVSRGNIVARLLGAAYLPLALYVILLSDSRLGIVAMLGAVLFYLLIWSALRWSSSKQSLIGPAVVLAYPAVFFGTIVASFFVGALRRAMWGSGAEQASTASRFTQWDMALPKILTHPLGHGIGEAAKEVGFRSPMGQITLDSYYILLLMDYGILGFLLYMGMFVRAAWIAGSTVVRARPMGEEMLLLPIAVSLMNFIVVKLVFVLEANHPLMFMMLGGTVALSWRASRVAASDRARSSALSAPSALWAPARG